MKKAVMLLAQGFEEVEALTVADVLRRAEVTCDMCSIHAGETVAGSHGIEVKCDKNFDSTDFSGYQALILPGGMPGTTNLRDDSRVIELVKKFDFERKYIGAICAAPMVLSKAGVMNGKKITSFPGVEEHLEGCSYVEELVVQDGNIITSRGPATAIYFALKLVQNLASMETNKKLKESMMVNFTEKMIKLK